MTSKPYAVKTRDVDGANTRRYATLDGAVKRFEEMLGLTVQQAIDESDYALPIDKRLPIQCRARLRGVSAYGTVVVFTADASAIQPVPSVVAVEYTPDDYDGQEQEHCANEFPHGEFPFEPAPGYVACACSGCVWRQRYLRHVRGIEPLPRGLDDAADDIPF